MKEGVGREGRREGGREGKRNRSREKEGQERGRNVLIIIEACLVSKYFSYLQLASLFLCVCVCACVSV